MTISGFHTTVGSGVIIGVQGSSGLIVSKELLSGVNVALSSGLGLSVANSGVQLLVPTTVLTNASGNPMRVTAASGGVILTSAAVASVIVKSLAANTLDLYVGGISNRPYSGQGFVLAPGEAINLPINQVGAVIVCATLSGERITWIGVV